MAAKKKAADAWTCPTCARHVTSPFCPVCGEERIVTRRATLRSLLDQLFHAVTSVDGKFLRSFRELLAHPGALTVAWLEGPRKPYLGPFQLFLLANVAFVAVQSVTGANIFSSTLTSHLHQQDWSAFAERLVERRLRSGTTTLEVFAPAFDRAVAWNAKSLVIVMTIPFALLLAAFFPGRRRSLALHLIFAVHVYSFLLFFYCPVLAIAAFDVWRGGTGLQSPRLDTTLTLLNLAASAAYLYVATGTVYGVSGGGRVVRALVLAASIVGIMLAYRFGLFVLTVYLV